MFGATHEPIIDSESFGNQGGIAPYDTRDVGKSANSNWFELARHDKKASELGRKPHRYMGIFAGVLQGAWSNTINVIPASKLSTRMWLFAINTCR